MEQSRTKESGPAPTSTPVVSELSQQPPPVDEEQVARRAYQRFVERGGEHGRDMEDWLEAERELRGSRGE